jgi:hypothetical protein
VSAGEPLEADARTRNLEMRLMEARERAEAARLAFRTALADGRDPHDVQVLRRSWDHARMAETRAEELVLTLRPPAVRGAARQASQTRDPGSQVAG